MDEKYIPSKQPRESKGSGMNNRVLAICAVAIVIVAGAVWFGIASYSNHNNQAATSNTSAQPSTLGSTPRDSANTSGGMACSQTSPCSGQQGGHPPVIGKITAVSSTSITIQPSDGSSARTFTIGSDVQVLNGANEAAVAYDANNFKVGETVGIAATGTDSNQADVILPNYQSMTSN